MPSEISSQMWETSDSVTVIRRCPYCATRYVIRLLHLQTLIDLEIAGSMCPACDPRHPKSPAAHSGHQPAGLVPQSGLVPPSGAGPQAGTGPATGGLPNRREFEL